VYTKPWEVFRNSRNLVFIYTNHTRCREALLITLSVFSTVLYEDQMARQWALGLGVSACGRAAKLEYRPEPDGLIYAALLYR
jgi:hypothetical protein